MSIDPEPNEVTYALGRLPSRTYVSRTFPLDLRNSQDYGAPARYVSKVFDEEGLPLPRDTPNIEWSHAVVMTTPRGRKQVKLQIARHTGQVREIQIQKVPTDPRADRMDVLLTLDRDASAKLIELVRALDYIPADDSQTVRIDDELLCHIFRDPTALSELYYMAATQSAFASSLRVMRRHTTSSRSHGDTQSWIVSGSSSRMTPRLPAPETTVAGASAYGNGFLRRTRGYSASASLASCLLLGTRANSSRRWLGFSVDGAGKRVDALLKTNGQIRSLVFAEIKHHKTALLGPQPYRSECWALSTELSGAVPQAQQTVNTAVREIGEHRVHRDDEGSEIDEGAFLVRPRSFLVAGDLKQFRGSGGGVNAAKYRSVELYRRNLVEPEIVTFDELLARAEWHVSVAQGERHDRRPAFHPTGPPSGAARSRG